MKQTQIRRQPSRLQRERRRQQRLAIITTALSTRSTVPLPSVDAVLADIDAALGASA